MSVLEGDCVQVLRGLDAESVQTCVTSPPYWGLRDYGTATWEGGDPGCDHAPPPTRASATCGKCGATRIDSQLGLEPTPAQYVENMVAVFREVRRVLRDDGTVWLNLGDSYNAYNGNAGPASGIDSPTGARSTQRPKLESGHGLRTKGLKPKDLVGIPWRVAFALQADGWWLRSDIVWAKPNPMPESVTDRPTRSHEYIFLLTKSARYMYDAEAIREEGVNPAAKLPGRGMTSTEHYGAGNGGNSGLLTLRNRLNDEGSGAMSRNKRSVWTVTTQPFPLAHFATFPPKLIEPCILAGSAKGDLVLDPFAGAGTTGLVAAMHDREFVGIELNPEYAQMARDRIARWEANPNGHLTGEPELSPGQLDLLGAA